MRRILLAISIVLMISALAAQTILVYQMNAVQTLVAEEEPHEEKPQKNNKKDFKENYYYLSRPTNQYIYHNGTSSSFYNKLKFCKGFAEKPFTPPDLV